jgi:hypothetical protein
MHLVVSSDDNPFSEVAKGRSFTNQAKGGGGDCG